MFNRILQSKWFTAAAVIIVGFLLASLIKIEPVLMATRKELKNLDTKIAEIEQSAAELERLGEYIRGDAYLERQARLKLNYKKPDEKVVYIYTRTTEIRNEEEVQKNSERSKIFENKLITNLKSWLGYLVNESR